MFLPHRKKSVNVKWCRASLLRQQVNRIKDLFEKYNGTEWKRRYFGDIGPKRAKNGQIENFLNRHCRGAV
jgi:hypothetical protein